MSGIMQSVLNNMPLTYPPYTFYEAFGTTVAISTTQYVGPTKIYAYSSTFDVPGYQNAVIQVNNVEIVNTALRGHTMAVLASNGSTVSIANYDTYGDPNAVTALANALNGVTSGNVSVTGNVTGNTAGFAIGYRDIPQVSFAANATIATADAGKHFYSTSASNLILTIANNASQAFQTGSALTIINEGTGNITVAQGSGVTLYLAGNATSGNRTISTFGMATCIKVATNTWFINGTGVA